MKNLNPDCPDRMLQNEAVDGIMAILNKEEKAAYTIYLILSKRYGMAQGIHRPVEYTKTQVSIVDKLDE